MTHVKAHSTTKIYDENDNLVAHFEDLNCGHQNNLLLDGRKTGVCPKDGAEFDE